MIRAAIAWLLAAALLAPAAVAQSVIPPDIRKARGTLVPDVELTAEDGTTFRIGDLAGKPTVISPIFTSCPHTCSFITTSLRDALASIGEPEVGYHVLTVSFDPADGPGELRAYRERLELPDGWRLAVASPENLAALLDAIDFRYAPLEGGGFAHANVVAIVDPELKVSGFVHGVVYETDEIRAELERAARAVSLVRRARPLLIIVSALGLVTLTVVLVATGRKQRRTHA